MPPFSVGVVQVEERLRNLRRRLNLFALQDGIYLGVSVLLVAASLVVVLAMRGQTTVFTVALWAAGAASAFAIAAAILRVRRRWQSLEQVVRFADRRAVLEDRLPTLFLDQTRASHLKDLLLAQTLAAAPQWDIDVLAPRRIPRSALLLAGSLAALIVTAYFARPPATPMSMAARPPSAPLPQADEPQEHSAPLSPNGDGGGSAAGRSGTSPGTKQAPGDGTVALPGSGMRRSGGTDTQHDGTMQAGTGAGDRDSVAQSRSAGHDGIRAEQDPPQMTAQVQDAIRAAFGAESIEREQAERDTGRMPPALSPKQHRESDLARDATGTGGSPPRPNSPSQSGEHPRDGQPSAAGAAASAGDQTDAAGMKLFAERGQQEPSGKPSQNLALKLSAFSSAAQSPSDTQPQKNVATSLPMAGGGGRTATAMSDEQVADAPVQKAEVAPEHEALVRRIFTRDE